MYRKYLILCLVLGIVFHLSNAQGQDKKKAIGFTFSSLGANEIIHLGGIDGAPDFQGGPLFSIGLTYSSPINNWLILETGLEFSRHEINVLPSLESLITRPPISGRSEDNYQEIFLISVPVTVKALLGKYLFINGGVLLDIDINRSNSIKNQSGLGAILGIGAQYDFNDRIGVFVNPLVKVHALVAYSDGDHLVERVVRFGLTYNL